MDIIKLFKKIKKKFFSYKLFLKAFLQNKKIIYLNKHKKYSDYLKHQKNKTTNPEKIKVWMGEEWNIKYYGFLEIFKKNKQYVFKKKNALCLGSRTGQEVKALIDLGVDAKGIDLVPFPPYTIEGDIHNIDISKNTIHINNYLNQYYKSLFSLFVVDQIEYIEDRRYNLVLSNGKIVMLPRVIDSKLINFIENNIDLIDKSTNYKKFLDLRNFHHKTIRLK